MSKKSKKKLLESTTKPKKDRLEWVFFAGIILIVFLPLLNLPPLFSPPGFGKTIIFRIVVGILAFLFIFKILFSKKQSQLSIASAVKIPLLLLANLFFIFLLATIFSQDWHHSFFDTPYRNGGSLNFFFYIIFAFLTFSMIKDEKNPEGPRQGGTYGAKWQKIWLAVLIVGFLACLIGIEQRFGLTKGKFIIYTREESPSTLGGAIFFGNYLVLLSFLSLALGIKEKGWKKRFFYIFTFLIFLFSLIFCAEKKGPLAGLILGLLWFIFAYPFTSLKKWWGLSPQVWFKSLTAILCLLGIFGLYFLKTHPEASLFKESRTLSRPIYILSSMFPSLGVIRDRLSAWQVGFASIKEKPIFGWGPENFSVAFDKNYDPSLPYLQMSQELYLSWWDKPHNIFVEYAVSAGILGLLAFLLLMGTLFWRLQRLKSFPSADKADAADKINPHNPLKSAESTNNSLLAHGVQTTFLAYFAALSFSFDTPSTYIILFLLVGFSLRLLKLADDADKADNADTRQIRPNPRNPLIRKWQWPIILFLFVILTWFIWNLNIKPLQINKEINIAITQSGAKNCYVAINLMENLLKKHSFLDGYLRLKYIIILDNCIAQEPQNSLNFAKRGWEISKENSQIRPTYIRNWIFLGGYANMLIEAETNPENIKKLKEEANFAFEKALKLSPKRQETYIEWLKTDLLTGEYQKAKEKSQKCIGLNPQLRDCYWLLGLSQIYLGNLEEAEQSLEIARLKGHEAKDALLQLAKVYGDVKYYPPLVRIFQRLIEVDSQNSQYYYASLAFVYKELGMYAEAKKEAEKILEIAPEAKPDVEKFLKELTR